MAQQDPTSRILDSRPDELRHLDIVLQADWRRTLFCGMLAARPCGARGAGADCGHHAVYVGERPREPAASFPAAKHLACDGGVRSARDWLRIGACGTRLPV